MSCPQVPSVAVTGNQPAFTPRNHCSEVPVTKTGTEMSTRVMARTEESKMPLRRMPETMPAPMPIRISNRIATIASLTVVG
jgi:hypothetical protein